MVQDDNEKLDLLMIGGVMIELSGKDDPNNDAMFEKSWWWIDMCGVDVEILVV